MHGYTTWQALTNFQREADRLDLQHHVLCLTFNSKLYFAPIEKPRNALDVGTGTGIWAIDLGIYHSSSIRSDAY
jgi:ubiquinone/menaquinone biosynthesis C-methylase UbiE